MTLYYKNLSYKLEVLQICWLLCLEVEDVFYNKSFQVILFCYIYGLWKSYFLDEPRTCNLLCCISSVAAHNVCPSRYSYFLLKQFLLTVPLSSGRLFFSIL